MDIEWALDGKTGELFIVQARPETIASQKNPNFLEEYILKETGKVIMAGSSVGMKIGAGKARVIKKAAQLAQFKEGEVLVAEMTDPDWEPIMKKASAIITDAGGRTCHAAIVSRELGVPCIVGAIGATKKIKNGQPVTVNCSEGEIGKIHSGLLKFEIKKTNLKNLKRPKTKIMMNVGNPYAALGFSFIPSDGVGLAREEFIIANYIKVHPLALLNFSKIKDHKVKEQVADITINHPKKSDFFVDKLAEGVGMIASAFYPKDVIIRMSDFKSNEYANLIGGTQFEPVEPNPMIGWRGASRYYSPQYEKAFALECQAFKKAREEFGLKNIKIMIPFCRTLEEGRKVIALLKKYGLEQGKDGLEVYVMCEIPSNVLLADKFCEIFDGFSIGSNDLTQLTLGVDRDSELVSNVYDENNEAVKLLISLVIEVAKANKRKIGICGQAPSDFPDFAKFLVREGIDSISLNPDTVLKTTLAILDQEKKLKKKKRKK
jgi:pyruvate,water dikinase